MNLHWRGHLLVSLADEEFFTTNFHKGTLQNLRDFREWAGIHNRNERTYFIHRTVEFHTFHLLFAKSSVEIVE